MSGRSVRVDLSGDREVMGSASQLMRLLVWSRL
jgi:hypothetical protein